MRFRNRNDLLSYIVALSDSENHGVLNTGEGLVRQLLAEGVINHDESDYTALVRMLWSLKDEGSLAFVDWTADMRGNRPLSYNDLVNGAAQIEVTGPGRVASGISRPNVSISANQLALGDILNVDMNVVIPEIERRIDSIDATDETKKEAKSRLRRLAGTAADVGTGAAGEVLAAALRQYGGLP
jgi:hypothetical protein